jgi:hypothetical protein
MPSQSTASSDSSATPPASAEPAPKADRN